MVFNGPSYQISQYKQSLGTLTGPRCIRWVYSSLMDVLQSLMDFEGAIEYGLLVI